MQVIFPWLLLLCRHAMHVPTQVIMVAGAAVQTCRATRLMQVISAWLLLCRHASHVSMQVISAWLLLLCRHASHVSMQVIMVAGAVQTCLATRLTRDSS